MSIGATERIGETRDEMGALVRAARAGQETAWEEIVRRFGGTIRAATSGFRLSAADADDVMQTTWLRLVTNIDRLEDPAALRGWLSTTAKRESLRLLQGQTREVPSDDPTLGEEPGQPTADERLLVEERRSTLDRAVEELPTRSRSLVRLMLARPDASYDEISSRLEIPVGSIGPTRGRALDRLACDPGLASLAC